MRAIGNPFHFNPHNALHLIAPLLLAAAVGMFPPAASGGQHGNPRRRHGAKRHVISHIEAVRAKSRRAELSHKLHGLHSHMHRVRAKIHEEKAKEVRLNDSIETVQHRLQLTRKRLNVVNDRMRHLQEQHDLVTARLDKTHARLTARRSLLSARLRETYSRGEVSYARVLIAAGSLQDLMSRGVYVRQIVQSDALLIRGVQQDIRQIQADKLLLERQARRQQALAAEFETRKEAYKADLAHEQNLLKSAKASRAAAQGELDELESAAQEMTGRIQSLSAMLERRRQAELDAWRERRIAARQHGSIGQEEAPPSAPVWSGTFIKPCSGPITSGFGYRYHPILHRRRLHTGVDVGAPYGTTIHAAGNGTVIMSSYVSGYGNCVIVDHGGGVTTLYGHCSVLLVSEGETVSQGQAIARVGATGMATGPHLHFEVRRGGVPVAPF